MNSSPESIVVSLDLAKQLKEAGWPQEDSVLYWNADITHGEAVRVSLGIKRKSMYEENIAAPTCEEVLRRLPPALELEGKCCTIDCTKEIHISGGIDKGKWLVGYEDCVDYSYYQIADTLVNAAAQMWLYLQSHNLLPQP